MDVDFSGVFLDTLIGKPLIFEREFHVDLAGLIGSALVIYSYDGEKFTELEGSDIFSAETDKFRKSVDQNFKKLITYGDIFYTFARSASWDVFSPLTEILGDEGVAQYYYLGLRQEIEDYFVSKGIKIERFGYNHFDSE